MARILIVDDEPAIVRGLEDNLRFEGYETLTATSGDEGLARALGEAPDLVLLDVMMPERSGWEVCRELRRRGVDWVVISEVSTLVRFGRVESGAPRAGRELAGFVDHLLSRGLP